MTGNYPKISGKIVEITGMSAPLTYIGYKVTYPKFAEKISFIYHFTKKINAVNSCVHITRRRKFPPLRRLGLSFFGGFISGHSF